MLKLGYYPVHTYHSFRPAIFPVDRIWFCFELQTAFTFQLYCYIALPVKNNYHIWKYWVPTPVYTICNIFSSYLVFKSNEGEKFIFTECYLCVYHEVENFIYIIQSSRRERERLHEVGGTEKFMSQIMKLIRERSRFQTQIYLVSKPEHFSSIHYRWCPWDLRSKAEIHSSWIGHDSNRHCLLEIPCVI